LRAVQARILSPSRSWLKTSQQENVMSQITKYLVGAAAAMVLTAWQGIALGTSLEGTADQPQPVKVRYADLDLNQPHAVRVLYHRIRLAADESCGVGEITGSHLKLKSWEQCVAHAVDETVTRLDRPALTAYHRQHTTDASWKG
jgi:UrcA family protein